MMKNVRLVVYVKDVQNITGRSESYARKTLNAIRKKLNKQKHELVSVEQLCQYLGVEERVVLEHLRQ
jgi:hypothetical protein